MVWVECGSDEELAGQRHEQHCTRLSWRRGDTHQGGGLPTKTGPMELLGAIGGNLPLGFWPIGQWTNHKPIIV